MSASAVYPASYCAVWVHAVHFSPNSLGEEWVQRWLTVLPILCWRGNGRNQQQEQATPAQWLQTYREHPGQVLSGELTRRRDTVAAVAEAGLVLRNTVCGDVICHLCFGSSVHFKSPPQHLHWTATCWHQKTGEEDPPCPERHCPPCF